MYQWSAENPLTRFQIENMEFVFAADKTIGGLSGPNAKLLARRLIPVLVMGPFPSVLQKKNSPVPASSATRNFPSGDGLRLIVDIDWQAADFLARFNVGNHDIVIVPHR